jgi:hypothetical protein
VLASACGSDSSPAFSSSSSPFEDTSDVKDWAQMASALGVYAHLHEVVSLARGELTLEDPACPALEDDGETMTVTGDCTDSAEKAWVGVATIVREGDDLSFTFQDFQGKDGSASLRSLGEARHQFEVDLVAGEVTTIEYTGTVAGSSTGPTVWNGSGRFQRDGDVAPIDELEATTAEQVLDQSVCAQPASGTTTLFAAGDTAVITYDGSTDCDDEQNARLSVNGEDRGMLAGILCTVRAPGAPVTPGAPAGVLAVLALATLVRRRVQRAREEAARAA